MVCPGGCPPEGLCAGTALSVGSVSYCLGISYSHIIGSPHEGLCAETALSL